MQASDEENIEDPFALRVKQANNVIVANNADYAIHCHRAKNALFAQNADVASNARYSEMSEHALYASLAMKSEMSEHAWKARKARYAQRAYYSYEGTVVEDRKDVDRLPYHGEELNKIDWALWVMEFDNCSKRCGTFPGGNGKKCVNEVLAVSANAAINAVRCNNSVQATLANNAANAAYANISNQAEVAGKAIHAKHSETAKESLFAEYAEFSVFAEKANFTLNLRPKPIHPVKGAAAPQQTHHLETENDETEDDIEKIYQGMLNKEEGV